MDDSRAALSKAYNTVRERYNKLRLQHRQLIKDRTCLYCRQKLCASVIVENSPDVQTTSMVSQVSPSEANEIHDICDQLKQLVAGQDTDLSLSIQSLIPRLQNVASHIATKSMLDDQGESFLYASASEVSSPSTLSRLHLESSKDLSPSVTGKMPEDGGQQDTCFNADTAPWLSDLQDVTEMATSQYLEMKAVCQHLKQQNESLRTLVKQLVLAKDHQAVCELGNADLAENDWSLLDK